MNRHRLRIGLRQRVGSFVLLAAIFNAGLAWSDVEQWQHFEDEGDRIVCVRESEGVLFYYGLVDGVWQALRGYHPDPEARLEECDEHYDLEPAHAESQPSV